MKKEAEVLINRPLISLKEASKWATNYLNKPVNPSNISYLIQYAKIKKYPNKQKSIKIDLNELKKYYDQNIIKKQKIWKKKLGKDLNWELSFDHLREADTTKHVHRLHPYKGKFIPQLVEYFLDNKTNTLKKNVFFKEGDIILDPFAGSGTTLIQASELGLHSIGIDISEFNCLISKVKLDDYNFFELGQRIQNALNNTEVFSLHAFDDDYDQELKKRISDFNKKYFPNPQYKKDIKNKKIEEKNYSEENLKKFLRENNKLLKENGTRDKKYLFDEKKIGSFLNKWFSNRIKQELFYYQKLIDKEPNEKVKNVMKIILSRTARSCRATTHSDLATLKQPQIEPYYCSKHKKICIPINTIVPRLKRNTNDTIKRLNHFAKYKKKVFSSVICGDSRNLDILEEMKKKNKEFYKQLINKKIDGVFTSPPYVGQIDYHEQHAYSYELFNIVRRDNKEIGPLCKGKGKKARQEYVKGISKVLLNISKFVKDDGDFFIVANDKYNLYPTIAEKSNLKIINQFKRPVLNRTERDRQPYAEIIFHMKKK